MEDRVIFRSLTRAPRWMGMERIPGALWVLGAGMLILTGLMYAGAFALTALVAAAAAAGIAGLRRLGDVDPVFFQVALRRLRYRDVYPVRVPRRATQLTKSTQTPDPQTSSMATPCPRSAPEPDKPGTRRLLALKETLISRVPARWRRRGMPKGGADAGLS